MAQEVHIYRVRKKERKRERKMRMNRYSSALRSYRDERSNRHRHVRTNLWIVYQNGKRIGKVGGISEGEALAKIPQSYKDNGPIELERVVIEE
jgi:hypothetical protein